jgi:hypothetical protein
MKKSASFFTALILTCLLVFMSCITTTKSKEISDKEFNKEDTKLVEAAILDYVEGLYLVDSTRILKSVDPKLRKIGFYYSSETKTYRDNLEMTQEQLVRLATRWNSDNDQVSENSPKEIEIFDVNTKTASAKLTAEWGIDLFHLAKVDNHWKIVNVIWQSQPENE